MKKALLTGFSIFLTITGGLQSVTPVVAKPTAVTPTTEAKPAPPQVELLNPGAEPRQALRFKPTLQAKQLATMTMNMEMEMKDAQADKSIPRPTLPGMIVKLETTVTKIEPNGNIHYQARYADFNVADNSELPTAALEQMRSQLAKMKDLKILSVVDNRGQTISVNFEIPESADQITRSMLTQVSESVEQASVALPEAAVGIGAKWRIASDINIFGMNLPQAATYELVNLQDGVATMNVVMEQQSGPQTMNLPGLLAEGGVRIKSLNTTGQGQVTMRFDRLLPTSAKIAVDSKAEMEISISKTDPPTVMNTSTKLDMVLTSE
jgi:Family of unknown function (DUF6263)